MTIGNAIKTMAARKVNRKRNGKIGKQLVAGIAILALLLSQMSLSFAEEKQETYERVIAHGGGAYKGYETSNSVEALNNAISNGYKIIELDMDLSSDNRIVMIHDWDRTATNYFGTAFKTKISQKKFLKLTVYNKFEVLTFEKLAVILKENPGVRIITDTKGDNLALLKKISEEFPDMTARIIPQIYDYDQWSKVKELGYSDIILTLYAMADIDVQKLTSFVLEKRIYAVAMPDYLADRGFCSKIAKQGIKVYVHPVSNFEDAQQYMKQGAYGVYSGTLLPEEFKGSEKDYYLTLADGNSFAAKLTDVRVSGLQELSVHGLKTGETVSYSIDGSARDLDQQILSNLKDGKHKLTVKIFSSFNKKNPIGSLDYFLWKATDRYRIVHKKYEYRLDTVTPQKDFNSVMEAGKVPEQTVAILEHSLIAKNGEHTFYSNGNAESYMNGEELLPVQKGHYGKLLLPLSATLKQLGAGSVAMNNAKDITVVFNNEKYMVMIDSCMIRKGFEITNINTPVVLYLNKAMAGGEIYHYFTGRNFLEKEDMIILLPEDLKTDNAMNEKIIKAAELLY